MALDGIFLYKLRNEMSFLKGAHLDKIYQPSKDELVFLLRCKEGAFRLFLSAKQGSARVHITSSRPENPASPPMFCMLLRKYLSSARIVDIEQNGFERVITFVFSSLNEMGDVIYPRLVCELIGSQPNIILTDENGTIIDAVHRSDLESSVRIIQSGAKYIPPEKPNKLNILETKTAVIAEKILSLGNLPLRKAFLDTIEGLSPLVARELSNRIGDGDLAVNNLTHAQKMNIVGILNSLVKSVAQDNTPVVIFDKNGTPKDFSFTDINQYSNEFTQKYFTDFSEALEAFYTEKENSERIRKNAQDIFKLIYILISRTQKKIGLRKKELEDCADREKLRIYGELIKANLYRLSSGMHCFEAENYYDENLSKITIPLDPALSPSANADKYFKDYKKSYNAEKMLSELIKKAEDDLVYFESVLDSLSRATSIAELNEIRDELSEAGIIKSSKPSQKKKNEKPSFIQYATPDGAKIFVGKNNRQNDILTLKTALKTDIWFHTKNIPGSHTVLICENDSVKDEDILYAARVAAYHSKASNSSNVPVDYTLIKYVKKPVGAKAGMVIYTNEQTLYVQPLNPKTNLD
ncbi:MAG: NFACT RNA binding domain-containing protein [Acutalibacteraceae bacterium]|nr:NFACT RNA binding domain-containing protein [Acutalibacteraceae bacterium]